MTNINRERVLVLDFGSQFTQLIARRVREAGVYCELRAGDLSADEIKTFAPDGIILSGGPESAASSENALRPDAAVFDLGVPVLGICYGMQIMAAMLGGTVEPANTSEFGYAEVRARGHSDLLRDIQDRCNDAGHGLLDVWMSHGDRVTELPPGFVCIASTEHAPLSGMADRERRFYALQFHPEVTHTLQGGAIYSRFVREICGCAGLWRADTIAEDLVRRVRTRVGDDRVLLALSGGVDSSVVAALLHRALGEQLVCVFVDNGLLRLDEADQVMRTFADNMGVNVVRVDAAERFLERLAGVADPEAKRVAIGHQFIAEFEREASRLDGVRWLAQGTIYPDVIESAGASTGKAHVIKSHHNVGGLPKDMAFELLEPLRELFKDEVRAVGVALGLPPEMVYRHPFPGPGLGVRILGEVTRAAADVLRVADDIFITALRQHGLYDRISQAFAVYIPVNSVGVTGDGRRYAPVIALRAVETTDFMTARWSHLPYELLDQVSRQITNRLPDISRVVYDISGKPPATIEWE